MPDIPDTWGSTNRRIDLQIGLGIKQYPDSKLTKAKRAGVMLQVVENLP
jgi:hypothetical protein